jgi:hypothetical protein
MPPICGSAAAAGRGPPNGFCAIKRCDALSNARMTATAAMAIASPRFSLKRNGGITGNRP